MRPTSRFLHAVASGGVLAGVGVLAATPVAVLGCVAIGCWLLVEQATAVREFREATDRLDIELTPIRNAAIVDESLSITVDATLTAPVDSTVEIAVALPPSAEYGGSAPSLTLTPGETSASTTFSCSFPVAGEFAFPPTTVTLENQGRTVTESIPYDPEQEVRIDPRRPRNLHVGQSGERIDAYGEHPAGSGGGGLVPEEIRQYVSGDALSQIDWKATARMQSPHIREFETETSRQTIIAIDHRHSMDRGPEGQTMLDYAREVALGYARAAESFDDPLGLYGIGDEGITVQQDPTGSTQGYRHIRNALHDIEPTQSEDSVGSGASTDRLTRPADARSATRQLADDDSAFAQTVAPFLSDTEAYVHRIESDPLFRTVKRIYAETTGKVWLVLLTTDTGRNRLRDTASFVASEDDALSLFLTPRVLFDEGAMDDVTTAYERYADFESFRKTVARTPRAEVYEVGPGDRLDALLAARRRARQS
jgi:uncharacterized protein (DUF58 family)